MIETFIEIAGTIENAYVREWKEKGGQIIGYPCSYLPEEVIYAAGMLPFRLRGVGTTSLSIGDTYFGPVICSFPKCILQLAGERRYPFLDGVIIVPGCDSMRRLDECWRKCGEDYEGVLPGYFHYFGVPHKVTDYSIEWFEEETAALIGSIEDHFHVSLSEDDLKGAVDSCNESRVLLKQLNDLRCGEQVPVTGAETLAIVIAGFSMPRNEYNLLLRQFLSGAEEREDVAGGKKRLLLVGSVIDDLDFIRVIEECGAVVVGDTLCFGARSYDDMVDAGEPPVKALARRYLNHASCPRMFGYYKERYHYLREKIGAVRADGVILQNIRFCDLHGSENGIFERDLEAEGIPCMRLEREYGPLVESGRLRMRIDAFMERLASR